MVESPAHCGVRDQIDHEIQALPVREVLATPVQAARFWYEHP